MVTHKDSGISQNIRQTLRASAKSGFRTSRRALLRAGAGSAGAAMLGRSLGSVAAQGTPVVPPGLTEGVDFYPSPAPGVPAAYVNLPEPFTSVEEVPGNGGSVSTFQINYGPPVAPRGENSYWQELETRLGLSEFNAELVPSANYDERFATVVAGGDLPDLFWVRLQPRLAELVIQGAFTDLTDYVTGDALQEYPNLAALDPRLWENVAVNGRIYSVPRPLEGLFVSSTIIYRQDWADTVGFAEHTNAAEFAETLAAFTQGDPDGNGNADTWGLGAGGVLALNYFDMMFRSPNKWRLNDDGTLIHSLETEEHRQAVAYASELWQSGVYHPDAAGMNGTQAKDGFVSGSFGGYVDGIGGLPGNGRMRYRTQEVNPNAIVNGLVPVGHDGGQGVYHMGRGSFGSVAIPADRDPDRVRELLRIFNYYAAPTGSEERIFLDYGVEGVHHTVQENGGLAQTELGNTEIGSSFSYLTRGAEGFYYPETPGDAKYMQDLVAGLLELGIEDPTMRLYSETAAAQEATLDQLLEDRHIAMIVGRDPLDAYDQLVSDWQSRGGDQIRQEYEQALQDQG